MTSPGDHVQLAELSTDELDASATESFKRKQAAPRLMGQLGPVTEEAVQPSGTIKALLKATGEHRQSCSVRLLVPSTVFGARCRLRERCIRHSTLNGCVGGTFSCCALEY